MTAVKFEQVVPIIFREDNILVNRNGDITFCFKYEGPKMCSKEFSELKKMTYDFSVGMTFLPDWAVLHKQDVYVKKTFRVDYEKEHDFLSRAYLQLYDGQEYLAHKSYLFVTKIQALSLSRDYKYKFVGKEVNFDKKNGAENVTQRENIENFERNLQAWKRYLATSGMPLSALNEGEVDEVIENYFSLYQDNLLCDIDFANKEIGFNKFEVLSVSSDEQMPEYLRGYRLNPLYSRFSKEVKGGEEGKNAIGLYSDYFCTLGYNFNSEHIVNQFFYWEGKSFWLNELEKRQRDNHSWRFFSEENGNTADLLAELRQEVMKGDQNIVRTHFNVIFWSEDASVLSGYKEEAKSRFKEIGVTAKVSSKNDIRMLYLASAPGNAGVMAVEETFIGLSSSLTGMMLKETVADNSLKKDKKGLLFTDRLSGGLVQRDCWFEPYENKKITNRNFLGIGKTGSGKSSMAIEVIRQYLTMGFSCTVLDIGRSFEVLAKNYNGNYIVYEDGLGLGVNPFSFEGNTMSSTLLEFLAQFTAVLWKPNESLNDDEMSALEKVILAAYRGKRDTSKSSGFLLEGDYKKTTIKHLFEYVENNQKEVEALVKGNRDFFNIDSFLLSIEKFVEGKFDQLFTDNNNIDSTKNLTVWELDNIKDHKTLFPILSMLITYLTTEVIWKKSEQEKIVLIEEAWKMLEKPGMASYIKWLYKTIRKFDGAVGINIQQIGDIVVPGTNIKETILANSDVKFIMSHTRPMAKELVEILDWTDYQHALLLSIPLDEKKEQGGKRFSELISVIGDDMQALRLQVSPEQIINFTSEMKDKVKLFELVEKNNKDWEKGIKEYVNNYM